MTTETKRDLQADLVLCEAATNGPWTHSRFAAGYIMTDDDKCTTVASVVEYNEDGSIHTKFAGDDCLANRTFIAESREGWPESIRRAIAAEAEVEQLREILGYIYQKARNDCAMWDGKMCVGLPVFQDRAYARKLVRDLGPILFPEVIADASR